MLFQILAQSLLRRDERDGLFIHIPTPTKEWDHKQHIQVVVQSLPKLLHVPPRQIPQATFPVHLLAVNEIRQTFFLGCQRY